MAVRRRNAAVRSSDRGMREQQFIVVSVGCRRGPDLVVHVGGEHRYRHECQHRHRYHRRRAGGGTASVPASIKSKGTITVAADASYPPNEFVGPDGKTVVGMDADLMKALGAVMGLKVNIVNQTFDSIIPGLAAGKYDVGASSFTDTKEREKTVDFVDYFIAGESFFTKASGGANISGIADICGKTVAVEKGTTEEADAQTQSGKCKKDGKPAVTVLSFPDQNGANLALSSGRAQLGVRRLAGRRLPGQEVRRHVQARRPVDRERSVRPGDAQEQRARPADAGGAQGADEQRQVQGDPHQVGDPERRHSGAQVKINGATS